VTVVLLGHSPRGFVTFPQSRLSNFKDVSGGDHPTFYLRPGFAAAFGEKIKSVSRKRFGASRRSQIGPRD
jgi:hypothetical protein